LSTLPAFIPMKNILKSYQVLIHVRFQHCWISWIHGY
jgi:hypothetical protein